VQEHSKNPEIFSTQLELHYVSARPMVYEDLIAFSSRETFTVLSNGGVTA
jgi:hypothetical protein